MNKINSLSWILKLSGSLAVVSVLTACSSSTPSSTKTVGEALGSGTESQVEYVARFESANEAKEHSSEAVSNGAKVQALDQEGRILKVSGDRSAVSELEVNETTLVHSNVKLQVLKPETGVAPNKSENPAESFLTARKVTGVEELLQKVSTADGRGVKVAVFDTGIDFGVQGIEKFADGTQKLVGFYDMTEFGKPAITPAVVEEGGGFKVGEKVLKIETGVKFQQIKGVGVLDEAVLAREYLAGEVIDLNQNMKGSDQFPFLVGTNERGVSAVWIDVNQDDKISAGEELTDFNSTYKHIDLRPEVSASGARALAVTITSLEKVQFHAVTGGHGTSCAIIIAGENFANGKLRGMAPKAQLVSFMLDVTGQDVYTLDQFLSMFIKAKELKVDAISISWGFATADLASARFVADFLDKEIASAGIVIGIAAGNDGPGLSTAAADDYIPHLGFGVGAHVSVDQARHVYGWTGADRDGVVWYSSFGPTRGGRQVPDAVSPLMSLVRGERGVEGPQFYAFSGTSSATPALIGSVSALLSALKQAGEKIDVRLLKLAVQASAKPVTGVDEIRQGAGLIDVSAAYDLYRQLVKREQPLELRAQTSLENQTLSGEGLHLYSFKPTAVVRVVLTEGAQKSLDPLTFIEPLNVVHSRRFFATPEVVAVQVNGAPIAVQFDESALQKPGIYSDVIKIVRPSDGLVLLRIPVVVEIAEALSQPGRSLVFEKEFGPFDLARVPFRLDRATNVTFEGFSRELNAGEGGRIGIQVKSAHGISVLEQIISQPRSIQTIKFQTGTLPAGQYEVVIFRHFAIPAVLNRVQLNLTARASYADLEQKRISAERADFVIRAKEDLSVSKAVLNIGGYEKTVTLTKDLKAVRPGYYGVVDLEKKVEGVGVRVRQSEVDRLSEDFLHVSLALVDQETNKPIYRGWENLAREGSPFTHKEFLIESQKLQVIAYPNIADWTKIQTDTLSFDVAVDFDESFKFEQKVDKTLARDQLLYLKIPVKVNPQGVRGTLELYDTAGAVIEKLEL